MKLNVGFVDRLIRIAVGVAIGVAGIVFRSWLGLIAIIPRLTARAVP